MKPDEVDYGVLCTEDNKHWEVPDHGVLRVDFLEEPNADRTLAEVREDRMTCVRQARGAAALTRSGTDIRLDGTRTTQITFQRFTSG